MTDQTAHFWKVIAVGGLGAALVVAAMLGGTARVGLPLPISGLMLLLMLFFDSPAIGLPIAALLLLLAYYGWVRPIHAGKAQFTPRTWLMLATLAALSGAWYYEGWAFGLKWQGRTYTLGCAVMSGVLIAAVAGLGFAGNMQDRSRLSLLGRWLAVVWIITYGYPWLGEFP